MRHFSLPSGIFAIVCTLLTGVTTAQAAIATWVSGTGTDAGNCQITAPCRTFAFAHEQTNNNGAINVLSSGNFGPLTITKPISIVADGVEAVINSGTGSINPAGIIVQAGGGAVISLRGLTIDLRGTDNRGISFVSGAALHVQDCVIRKASTGIIFSPSSGINELYVADSVVANSGGVGIAVVPTGSASAKAVLDRVRVENSAVFGIHFAGTLISGSIAATVRDSVAAGNTSTGIIAAEGGSGTTTVTVDRSASVNNGAGIAASGVGATVRIGDSTVTGNGTGLLLSSGGVIESYGTNKVNGNNTNGAPTGAPIAMK